MPPTTISGINQLSYAEKREIYTRLIPAELLERFCLSPQFVDKDGHDLIWLHCPPQKADVEMALRHQSGFPDPILYGHMTDTLNGQIHILLYVLNDPESPRFDIDRLPDGTSTKLGSQCRNIEAEEEAMQAGLAPGQIRAGLRLLPHAIKAFERFIESLGHDLHFAEPLYYHNAIIFERYGFAYAKGKKLMDRIQSGFSPGGDLLPLLDDSNPFRRPEAAYSVRLRSWAIHDGILGKPFSDVTMYKNRLRPAGLSTSQGCPW
jgi:hypothetical protein